jgi:rubredoxin
MKCSLCGLKFEEEDAKRSCQGCLMSKGCGLVRCPNCGFEMAPDPKWLKKLKKKVERK